MKATRWRNERPKRLRWRLLPATRGVRAGVWLGALVLGALAGALGGDALLTRLFPERAMRLRYSVIGNVRATPLELATAAAVAPGTSFGAIDLPAVRSALAGHPWVRHARVAALPPDRVILAVEEREPVAVARLAGEARLVDRDGTAFAPADVGTELPELVGAGAPGSPPLLDGVTLLDAVAQQGLPAPRALILAGEEPGTTPALELAAGITASGARVLIGNGDQPAKLARLARLLEAGLPELAGVEEIDLRFGDDVVLRPRLEASEADSEEETVGVRRSAAREGQSS
jgi:cell division protein FtsQ